MSSSRKLNVPLIAQQEEFWCVPACIKMVLEYLNSSGMLTVPTPSLALLQIARIVKTQDGTAAHDVPAINEWFEEAVPSVEFEDDYRSRRVNEIEVEIANKRPCIPWMFVTDGIHRACHAVVVTDIDIEANSISYNDPGPPRETTQKLSAFEVAWTLGQTNLLKVQIGRNTRTVLTQFGVQP
jgi:hypothetical protein